jgi:hypothetical protein
VLTAGKIDLNERSKSSVEEIMTISVHFLVDLDDSYHIAKFWKLDPHRLSKENTSLNTPIHE